MSRHRIFGTLARDAEVRRGIGGSYGLFVELSPASNHIEPIVAHRDHGHDTPGAIAANSAARHMRRGARVYVHCIGIGIGHNRDNEPAIRCIGVDQIELLDLPADYIETTPASLAELNAGA